MTVPTPNGAQRPTVGASQLTLFDVTADAVAEAAARGHRTRVEEIRADFDRARGIAVGRLETARDAATLYRDLGRMRERMAALETALSDVERALGKLIRGRADQVRSEVEVVQRVAGVLEATLTREQAWRVSQALQAAGLAGIARAMADPGNLTDVMRDQEDDGESAYAIAGQIHGWENDDAIANDPDLDGIDVEAD